MTEVTFKLNGRDEILKPTLRAARIINSSAGGFTEAFKKIGEFNLETYVAIIAAGLNKRPSDIEDAVYKTGLTNLAEPCSKFISILANGGKDIDETRAAAAAVEEADSGNG